MYLSGVLEALGKPESIQLLTDSDERRSEISIDVSLDEQTVDVPQSTYEGYSLVLSGAEFITGVKEKLGWDGEVFAVECFLVKDSDRKIVVLTDLTTAMTSE